MQVGASVKRGCAESRILRRRGVVAFVGDHGGEVSPIGAKKHGLRLGWYYSTRDWTHPDYLQGDNKAYNEYYENQDCAAYRDYRELTARERSVVWDGRGDWYGVKGLFDYLDTKDTVVAALVRDVAALVDPLARRQTSCPSP
mgnify:CR=1 FL=1